MIGLSVEKFKHSSKLNSIVPCHCYSSSNYRNVDVGRYPPPQKKPAQYVNIESLMIFIKVGIKIVYVHLFHVKAVTTLSLTSKL